MWTKIRSPLFMLSISLNLAVIVIWLVQVVWSQHGTTGERQAQFDSHQVVQSSLHREIGVTAEQWKQIEPFVLELRQKSASQQHKLEALRQQLLRLLAKTPTDMTAIHLKQKEILAGQEQLQNLVIGHLLKEKEILSPSQLNNLIQEIHRQCMHSGDMTSHLDLEEI